MFILAIIRYKYFENIIYTRGVLVGGARPRTKKMRKIMSLISQVSTNEILKLHEPSSEEIVRLKVTVRKGARIESVPLKKLKKLTSNKRRYWTFEDGWKCNGLHSRF